MRSRIMPALCALVLFGGGAAGAQFTQYSEPGSLALEARSPAEEAEERAERARWKLGRWRIAPDFAISDVAWTDNVYDTRDGAEQVSDVTGTVRAGLDGYIHLGPDVIFTLYGRPSYTYWQDQEDLRSSHVSFGSGLFGLHNRLAWELAASHEEEQSYANDELRVPLDLEREQATIAVRVEVGGPFALFARAQQAEALYPRQAPEGGVEVGLTSLDREESLLAGGLLYRPGDEVELGLGVERSDVDFESDPGGRSSTATSPLLSLEVSGNRFELGVNAVLRQLEFDNPDLGETEELTGRGRAAWRLASRTTAALYGGRSVVYSALDERSYFTAGVGGIQLGWSSRPDQRGVLVALIGESAVHAYEGSSGGLAGREDDLTNYGLTFAIPYRELLTFEIGVIQSEVDSNLPEFDRSYTTVRTGLRLEPLGPSG